MNCFGYNSHSNSNVLMRGKTMIPNIFRAVVSVLFKSMLWLGCFWQICDVCHMYFKYPTNVFIDTTFDPLSKPLPALTFCANIGWHDVLNTSALLEIESSRFKYNTFRYIYIRGENGIRDMKEEYLASAIESTSYKYYCIAFNSLLSGSFSKQFNVFSNKNFNQKFKLLRVPCSNGMKT